MQARAEHIRNFFCPQRAARSGDHIEQDLEALGREVRRELFELVAADHEEAAHRIGNLNAQQDPRQRGGELAEAEALLIETVSAAAVDIAAADHNISLAPLDQAEHLRQLRFVVLHIAVDDGGARRARREHALDAGPGQTTAADALDAANPRVVFANSPHLVRRTIRRIVINEDDLPGNSSERLVELVDQRANVTTLVKRRDDHRQLTHPCLDGLWRDPDCAAHAHDAGIAA